LASSILSDTQSRVRALVVLAKRYHPKMTVLIKEIWERYDATSERSLVRTMRELGGVVLLL
jgi:hypothetical protein